MLAGVYTNLGIGNAKIEGLMDDLHLTGTQYNIALSIFFVPYVILGKREYSELQFQ
jgi:hypothetical protein